jgi:hypothetical protein
MDMGQFLNGFAQDGRILLVICVADLIMLAVFSYLYNAWVGKLGEKKNGYTAILVAIGNAVTLLLVAIVSWKAAVLVSLAFVASGFMMIIGDIQRDQKQREQAAKEAARPRRKALPYAARSLIDEASMLLAQVERSIKALLEGKLDDRKIGLMALAVKEASIKLAEARKVEGE